MAVSLKNLHGLSLEGRHRNWLRVVLGLISDIEIHHDELSLAKKIMVEEGAFHGI